MVQESSLGFSRLIFRGRHASCIDHGEETPTPFSPWPASKALEVAELFAPVVFDQGTGQGE